tara:strand:+ start:4153 stop:5046 length:894 start_codon:yes stop_codon:yes gene_type:complete
MNDSIQRINKLKKSFRKSIRKVISNLELKKIKGQGGGGSQGGMRPSRASLAAAMITVSIFTLIFCTAAGLLAGSLYPHDIFLAWLELMNMAMESLPRQFQACNAWEEFAGTTVQSIGIIGPILVGAGLLPGAVATGAASTALVPAAQLAGYTSVVGAGSAITFKELGKAIDLGMKCDQRLMKYWSTYTVLIGALSSSGLAILSYTPKFYKYTYTHVYNALVEKPEYRRIAQVRQDFDPSEPIITFLSPSFSDEVVRRSSSRSKRKSSKGESKKRKSKKRKSKKRKSKKKTKKGQPNS